MTEKQFADLHLGIIDAYWDLVSGEILLWKRSYQWRGQRGEEALGLRDKLEQEINKELAESGSLSKRVFDNVIIWGFGSPSRATEEEISDATSKAFTHLSAGRVADAASEIMRLPGVGISRASKVLALSNQTEFGIYDSRAADGLSDLMYEGRPLIPIPPGRSIAGDALSPVRFAAAFERYIWLLREFRRRACRDNGLAREFRRLSDLELAFFARSRASQSTRLATAKSAPRHISSSDLDEESCILTLGRGTPFWAEVKDSEVTVWTGKQASSKTTLSNQQMETCLATFAGRGWFPLGNCVDALQPNGLGQYFKTTLKLGAKLGSHFAALWVLQGRLEFERRRNAVWLRLVGKQGQ